MTHRTHTPVKSRDKSPNLFTVAQIFDLLRDIPDMTSEKAAQLQGHWRLMVESDDKTDLTRITSPTEIALKHYLDCALPLKYTNLPSPLLDIGTGAGFPGLVLKILSPKTEIILGENRPKRVKFLEHVIAKLGLQGVTVYPHRIGPQFPLEIQGVVTRALESARDTLYRVQPFLPVGGRVILLKGPKGEDEISEAVDELPDFQHEKTHSYRLADSTNERRLVVFRRERESLRNAQHLLNSESPARRITEITSRANDQFKSLLTLSESRGIRKANEFLVSGEKLIQEIIRSESLVPLVRNLITFPEAPEIKTPLPQIMLAANLFRELDSLGTRYPLALMKLPAMPDWNPAAENDGITVFLPFQDPGNIGAALRSAAAFGVQRVVLLKEGASPFLPKAVRAAANALFTVELFKGPSLAEFLELGLPAFRLDAGGKPIQEIAFPGKVFLLPGVEGYGFPQGGRSTAVAIPISENVESLNAQSALAIALYEIARRPGGMPSPTRRNLK